MPLHDFVCCACGHEFEALVMGKDQPLCPKCQNSELIKLMSTFVGRTGDKVDSGNSGGGSKCSGCASGNCSTCH